MKKLGPIQALGTVWWFEFFHIQEDAVPGIERLLNTTLQEFELRYSRFLPDSELSQLNTTKQVTNPSSDLQAMLEMSMDMYYESDGVFNPAVGGRLVNLGYGQGEGYRDIPEFDKAITITGQQIRLQENTLIDLGGIGKGYLIDKLSQLIMQEGIDEFLINGGGDMYGTTNQGQAIDILLENPAEAGDYIGQIVIQNEGFAASSPNKRRWINPNTGEEEQHLVGNNDARAVFVVAPTAVAADMWATVLSVAPDTPHPPQIEAIVL